MAKELHIRITDQIGITEDLFCWWPGFTALELEWRLQEIPNPEKIVLHISSPGGDVQEGLAIYSRLLELRESGIIISVIIESHCYSIATLIAMAASPGELKARESSLWCVHKPLYPEIYCANADDLRHYASQLDACEGAINAAYVARTGKTLEDVQAQLRLDTIINAQEAAAAGWIDATIPSLAGAPEPAVATALKPVAFVRPKKTETKTIENKMSDKKKPIKAWDKLKALAQEILADGDVDNPAPVNASVKLANGSEIFFEGELADGVKVYTDAEMQTPAENGTYELEDGRSITVTDGAITAIVDAPDETAQALAAKDEEIETLTKQIETLQGAVALVPELQTTITNLKAEVEKVKNFVPGGGDTSKKPAQTYANYNTEKKGTHPLDAAAEKIKNRTK